jgi:hypothetical protein
MSVTWEEKCVENFKMKNLKERKDALETKTQMGGY